MERERGVRWVRQRRGRGKRVLAALVACLSLSAQDARAEVPLEVGFQLAGSDPSGKGAKARSPSSLEIARRLPLPRVGEQGSFSVVVQSPTRFLPTSVGLWSTDATGAPLDQLGPMPLELTPCPPEVEQGSACARTGPVWLVPTSVDRGPSELEDVTLQARVGGQVVADAGTSSRALPVAGPTALAGAVHRMRLKISVLRTFPSGPSALDPDDARTKELATAALQDAAALWGQCGFALGEAGLAGSGLGTLRPDDVRVVDPPKAELLEIGCDGGLPARGGQLELATRAGPVKLVTRAGETPGSIAVRLSLELERRGFVTRVAENPPTESGAGPSYDVLVASKNSWSPELRAPSAGKLTTDASLGVCLGQLDLADGLRHFEDETARAGTLEERTLLRGLAETERGTVSVLVVPYFSGRGRIGEAFIGGSGAPLENLVLLDRAGLRATARSSTLAHELGHVLLAQPGHPDDFGSDEPSRLMDADASDASAFGPRRLLLEECERALTEHGPGTAVPLLEPADQPARTSQPPGRERTDVRPNPG